jgi:hypothetical protein
MPMGGIEDVFIENVSYNFFSLSQYSHNAVIIMLRYTCFYEYTKV